MEGGSLSVHRHILILDYAVTGILKRRWKSLVVVLTYSGIVFLLASILFMTDALKYEAMKMLEGSPELIVQRLIGGRHDLIPVRYMEKISSIRGVREVSPRLWGYYYDPPTDANYTILAADAAIPSAGLEEGSSLLPISDGECLIGQGIYDARFLDLESILPMKRANGELHVLRVKGILTPESSLMTNDLVVATAADVKRIFGIPDGSATDLAVSISNPREVDTIALKILEALPDTRTISRNQLARTYEAVFDWRGGLLAVILLAAAAAFIILAWDKATGLSEEERREIGLLKASGWMISDVLELKMLEGAVLSFTSFLTGVIAAYVHVFMAGGTFFLPVLKGWSTLFPEFALIPRIDLFTLTVLMFLTVFPYIAVTILPSWKAAATEPDLVMRG
ncbi:MAG: ABC transporter permease [Deltaproteobacteria bacterium]|nr:ABC transporter permease [Deltaproteobacteria bacterium]